MTDAQDYMFQRLDMMEKRQKEINDLLTEGNLPSQKLSIYPRNYPLMMNLLAYMLNIRKWSQTKNLLKL